jgi:exosortase D (VPLPA-CTERM-specific)
MFAMWGVTFDREGKYFFVHYQSYALAPLAAILIIRNTLKQSSNGHGAYIGIILLSIAIFLGLFGKYSSIYYVANIGFLLALLGLFIASWGIGWVGDNWKPVALLLLLVPMPHFILIRLFSHLTTLAAKISVLVAQFLGLSVFIEGNMLEFGGVRKNALDVGSPFSYLFLCISLGLFLLNFTPPGTLRYLVNLVSGPAILFAATVFRIVGIARVSNARGASAAEAFGAATSGPSILAGVVFMQMLIFAAVLTIGGLKTLVSGSARTGKAAGIALKWPEMRSPVSVSICVAMIICAALLSAGVSASSDREMPHVRFERFPTAFGLRQASPVSVDPVQLKSMQLNDFLSVDFTDPRKTDRVNVWVAYYSSQKPGGSIHSPKACLSGSGWEMSDCQVVTLKNVIADNKELSLNRAIMKQGSRRQLTYFWYNVAGTLITNEYLVKWHIFWNKLTKHRSDGALIRLITTVGEGEAEDSADARLQRLMRELLPALSPHIPKT